MRNKTTISCITLILLVAAIAGGLWWRRSQIVSYVPKTLDDSHAHLLRLLSASEIGRIRAMTNEDQMVEFHFGLGTWIRNDWGLWKGGELATSLKRLGLRHPDDMSSVILDTFWCKLHDQPFRLEERVAYYEDYWRSVAEPKGGSPKDGGRIAWVITQCEGKGAIHLGISLSDRTYWRYEYGSDRGIERARTNECASLDELLKTWDSLGTKLEDFADE